MPNQKLRILHVTRAPIGGIIRHILDVAHGQVARGHDVGIVCDSTTGGERANEILGEIAPHLALGLTRFPIPREPSPIDPFALARVARAIEAARPDVVHGHGAKGAAFSRISSAAPDAIRVYTPHGGSLNYPPTTLAGIFYSTLERLLMNRTDLFLFESAFARQRFLENIGTPRTMVRVVCNGVTAAEFEPVALDPDATDIFFIGEFRRVKGVDLVIEAVARLNRAGRNVRATLAGDGAEDRALREQVARLGLSDKIRFVGFQPPRRAFAMGRIFVMPTRADLLPYALIEAAAAGVPIISTRIGGIPEIFGPHADLLLPPDDLEALVQRIATALDQPELLSQVTADLRERARKHFSQDAMVEGGLAAYRDAIDMRHGNVRPALTVS